MKKVVSIVLAVLMMLPIAAMLIPTASAATTVDTSTTGAGKVYYEENFDDPALAGLVDKDLAAALGWNAPGDQATMWMENGKVRVFTQYTPSGVYPATANKWGTGYNAGVLVSDYELIRNTTVLEYKFTYNRRAAGEENNVTVTTKDGKSKTVKADGQGTYQCVEFYYTNGDNKSAAYLAGSDNAFVRINQGGDGWANTMKGVDGAGTDKNAVWWKTTTFEKVNAIPAGDTIKLEMHNNPVVTTESEATLTSTIMNREYSVKVIIEPWAHRLYAFVDGQLFITKATNVNGAQYGLNDWGRLVSESVGLLFKPGVDATVDDIKLYDYVPNLTISEVMVNGTKANGTGKYQWIEITNPSDNAVNVYDYAIHLENMANTANKPAYVIGGETDQGTGAWYVDAASTLGYFTPGAKTLGTEVFDSPAYEDGVLQPGESAIVLFPQTAMAGGTSVTDEAFNAYLQGLGMPAGTKTFVVDNESNYNFSIGTLTNESATLQIVKATNTATDGSYKPVADCKGQVAEYSPAYAECTVWVTSKGSGSGTAYWGMTVKNYQNVPQDALGSNAIFGTNTDKSYEIDYSGWVNAYAQQEKYFEHTNLKWGFSLYQPNDTRKDANGKDVYATPGFVPVECRRVQTATVTAVDGTVSHPILNPHYDNTISVATPKKTGYAVQVWVDGELAIEDAIGAVTDITFAADEVKANTRHTVEVKYFREGPMWIGYQKSAVDEDGFYTLRLLAAVNDPDSFDTFGFQISAEWDGGIESKSVDFEAGYVYKSVTAYTDGDATEVTAESYGFDYLYAVHIKNISVDDAEDLKFIATVTYTLNGVAKSDVNSYELSPNKVQ